MDNILYQLMSLEAKDYTPNKDKNWINAAVLRLYNLIKEIDGKKYSYVKIINRRGVDSYSFLFQFLLPQSETDDLDIYVINICDCGELNHLFYIH